MNQEVGSIMGYFYQIFPCKIYTKEVPTNIETPSMYFPTANDFDGSDTTTTFKTTYSLSVKLFHKDAVQAKDAAELISNTVRRKRYLIPLLNADGSVTGDYIRINRIETRVTDGVANIIVTWDSRYFYVREKANELKDFFLSVKEGHGSGKTTNK
ncbi:phage portal protein [Heyndrickxia oleronia]|uniref:phage tail terminator family protein n=1 Tax=Heyndrickxia oleronia TaxID=38875 RepID=UPI00203E8380|nr:phage portal protein [Heyndrickxia oleronia]MCM3452737.1 phage portal protein [Heyndrickxia oleronia]